MRGLQQASTSFGLSTFRVPCASFLPRQASPPPPPASQNGREPLLHFFFFILRSTCLPTAFSPSLERLISRRSYAVIGPCRKILLGRFSPALTFSPCRKVLKRTLTNKPESYWHLLCPQVLVSHAHSLPSDRRLMSQSGLPEPLLLPGLKPSPRPPANGMLGPSTEETVLFHTLQTVHPSSYLLAFSSTIIPSPLPFYPRTRAEL